MVFGKKIIDFYQNLSPPENLPKGIEVLFPFRNQEIAGIIEKFNLKYFNDENPRTFLIGINPGRLGGGSTGIPFTDPLRLESILEIENSLEKKQELSSNFIYQMIDALGGPDFFYSKFYFTSVCSVGFVKDGKNLNYYDLPALQNQLESYMVDHLKEQISYGANPVAYSLGQGKNIAYLKTLNKRYQLFESIEPLPHPRWIMQYRLKRLDEFLEVYKEALLE